MSSEPLLINGQLEVASSAGWVSDLLKDRGLAYGDGLFETVLLSKGRCPFWAYHLERLLLGVERLAIPLSRHVIEEDFHKYIGALTQQNISAGVIKLLVTRGRGGQGYYPASTPHPSRFWQYRLLPEHDKRASQGVRLAGSSVRLGHQPLLAGIKHLNRLEYIIAGQRAAPGYEPLLMDSASQVIETLSHNIFAVKNEKILTPTLNNCGVAGVLRQWLLDYSESFGFAIAIGNLSLNDLLSAEEIFIGNSVRGFWPVTNIDNASFSVGPVCMALQNCHRQYIQSTYV